MELAELVKQSVEEMNSERQDEFKRKVKGTVAAIAAQQEVIKKALVEIEKLKVQLKAHSLETVDVGTIL